MGRGDVEVGGGGGGGEDVFGWDEGREKIIYSNQTVYETALKLVHGPEEEISTLIISIPISSRITKRELLT